MHIGIDIDGTIAGRNRLQFVTACNQQFQLELSPEQLQHTTYAALMKHPTIIAAKTTNAPQFEAEIERIEQAPQMLSSLPPLPGAVEGVRKLAQFGSIAYYTVRKAHTCSDEEVQQATQQWLYTHQFPAADQTIFCMSLMNKLLKLFFHIKQTAQPLIMIDDLAEQLATAFTLLQQGQHPKFTQQESHHIADTLRQHLHLVAFGVSAPVAITSDLPFSVMPTWEHVDDVIHRSFLTMS